MITQVRQGNCDNLFYIDVESYFMANFRILTRRNAACRYVLNVLSKSTINMQQKQMVSPQNWEAAFTFGEYKIILPFREQVNDIYFFDTNGYPNKEKIKTLLKDIEIGLWDEYLCWSFEAYQNVKSQNYVTQAFAAQLANATKNIENHPNERI